MHRIIIEVDDVLGEETEAIRQAIEGILGLLSTRTNTSVEALISEEPWEGGPLSEEFETDDS